MPLNPFIVLVAEELSSLRRKGKIWIARILTNLIEIKKSVFKSGGEG
jgi:hypothetical protein